MANYLAIEWSRREVRYLAASTKRSGVSVLAADAIPLEQAGEETESPESQVATSLQTALAEQHLGKPTVLVVVGRNRVELLDVMLPPAEDRELAELVGNVAQAESSALREGASLDFVVRDRNPKQQRSVSAAVLPAEELSHINAICDQAGLKPQRIGLRPYPTVSLLLRGDSVPSSGTAIFVNLIDDEADLAVVSDGCVTVARSVRLPAVGTEETAIQALLAELKRTLVIAPVAESGETAVETIYVCGRPAEHDDLIQRIHEELGLPVELFDVFAAAEVKGEGLPDEAGAFAPLLGIIKDEMQGTTGTTDGIDFLHPKKPPKPPNHKRTAALITAAVLAVVAGGGYYVWNTLATVDAQNRILGKRANELNDLVKKARRKRALYASLYAWHASSVNWLDELRDLALRLPSQRDVMFQGLAASPSRGGGSSVALEGIARSPDVVNRLEMEMRDQFHQIRTPRLEEKVEGKKSTWHFESSLLVKARDKAQYLNKPSETDEKHEETTNKPQEKTKVSSKTLKPSE